MLQQQGCVQSHRFPLRLVVLTLFIAATYVKPAPGPTHVASRDHLRLVPSKPGDQGSTLFVCF